MINTPSRFKHTKSIRSLLLVVVLVVVLIAVLVGAAVTAKQYLVNQQGVAHVVATHSCSPDLNNCAVTINNNTLKLRFDHNETIITSGHTMTAFIETSSASSTPQQISFQGKDMYMGENHFALTPQSNERYSSEVQLPACTTGEMTWQATVRLDNGDAIVFEFNAR